MKKILRTSSEVLAVLACSFNLFLVSPLSSYLLNPDEFRIGVFALTIWLVGFTTSCAVILYLIVRAARKVPGVHFVICVFISGVSALLWLHSQVLVWDLGYLDGRGLNWERWRPHAVAEVSVWIVFLIWVGLKARKKRIFIGRVSAIALLLGATSLLINFVNRGMDVFITPPEYAETDIFKFSIHENKVVLVLDTFQSDVFDEIRQRWPAETAFLDGFQYFPDTLGGYPTTQASIPLILTGNFYQNNIPVRAWTRANYQKFNLPDALTKNDYAPVLVSINPSTLSGISAPTFTVSHAVNSLEFTRQEILLAVDAGLFRAAPLLAKRPIYDDGNWFFQRHIKFPSEYSNTIPGRHGGDLSFISALEDNAFVDNSPDRKFFKFFHLNGAHWPLQINEHYEFVTYKGRVGREEYVAQARGVLLLARRFIETLKRIGAYQGSEIVIVGDHGSRRVWARDINIDMDGIDLGPAPFATLSSSRPLFLYKAPHKQGPLATSSKAMSLSLLACILTTSLENCTSNESSDRYFYYYDWSKEYQDWSREYMPPMLAFRVQGDSRNVSSWKNERRIYSQGEALDYEPGGLINAGTVIDFSADGNSNAYLGPGWSGQSKSSIWTDADNSLNGKSYLNFKLATLRPSQLKLTVDARAIVPRGDEYQQVTIKVDGQEVGEISFKKKRSTYAFSLPREILEANAFTLEFDVKTPVRPCEISSSSDCRLLGLDVYSISFE